MRRAGLLRDGFVPAGAALMLALPLSGIGTAAIGAGRPAPSGVIASGIAGLDTRRVVVAGGELAGHAVQVSEVASRLEPAEALARVEHHWREQADHPVLHAESGVWSVLSRRLDEGFETLQLRASRRGGSEGLLTTWRGRAASPAQGRSLAHLLPDDARMVRQLTSRDADAQGARAADTLIGRLPHAIDEAELRIDRQLRRAGFSATRQPDRRRDLAWRDDRARFYHAAGAEVLVTLHAQPHGTAVVLYHVGNVPMGGPQ